MNPLLTRRRALTLLGVGAVTPALLPRSSAQAAGTCTTTETNEVTIGPYYVDEGLVRSDITGGQSGVPLTLTLTFLDIDTCEPLSGAAVDIWHANAAGHYSDESSEGTLGETYLRGIQITDANGQVTFQTIYPGWYSGRTVHIHSKIRTGGTLSGTSYTGGTNQWIGQVFFDESVTEAVAQVSPYSSSTTTRTTNSQDSIFAASSPETTLTVSGSTAAYTATATINVAAGGAETGGTTSTGTPCVFSGSTTRRTTHGTTVPLTGTAAPGATVEVFFRAAGQSAYTLRRTLTANSSGVWSTSYVATTTYAIYAEADDDLSDVVYVLLAPTISGAATKVVTRGSSVTITGYSVPNSTTTLKFHKKGTSGYLVTRTVATNSSGVWTKTYTATTDYRFYAIGANGLTSATHLVQVA